VHNDKIGPILNKTTRFTLPETRSTSRPRVRDYDARSASASELVPNSLRPFMPVIFIGDTTCGKPVGQYGLRFCDKILWPVAFSIRTRTSKAITSMGLPDCQAADDATHQLGDPEEASFAEALTYHHAGRVHAAGATGVTRLEIAPVDARLAGWDSLINAQ
jgi:hypothetical protein